MCAKCALRQWVLFAFSIAVFVICLVLVFLADETFNLGSRTAGTTDVTFFIMVIYLVIAALPAAAVWAFIEKHHGVARIERNGEIRFRNQQYNDLFRSANR
jgi:type III secretory pathway component EscT